MSDAASFRSLEDRYHRLQDLETPTDKANRQRTERAQVKQQLATTEAQHQRGLQAARNEDALRTKQHTKATKLIAKINKSTQKLTNALPEARGGGGEVGKLSKHYNKAMKTMGSFIKDYTKSNPTHNPDWHTLTPKRQRELVHFHQSLSSNAQHHIAINKFNTAKKHAEAAALESGLNNFRSNMTLDNQQNLDGWMNYLDIPVVVPLVSAPVVAQVISSSAKTNTGGRKTRKCKRKHKRKTRKRKKKTKRKHKKRHRRTKRR
uniref:Uncharacterized protein n=1 Tax=viral metagenome TaxID=1070528 RepID=A0A6C0EP09_9ZZZZ